MYADLDLPRVATFDDIRPQFAVTSLQQAASLLHINALQHVGCATLGQLSTWKLHPSPFDTWSVSTNASASFSPHQLRATLCRRHEQSKHAIIVPTHLPHQDAFLRLVQSIVHFLGSGLDDAAVHLSPVFSSVTDMQRMLPRIVLNESRSRLSLRPLLFDLHHVTGPVAAAFKFKYQCAKKLWALHHLIYEHALLLDSDFEVRAPVDLAGLVASHKGELLAGPVSTLRIDRMVLHNVNRLIGANFTTFPLELPWVISKVHLDRLCDFLVHNFRLQKAHDLYPALLHHPQYFFEIILYRLYVLATAPQAFTTVVTESSIRMLHARYRNNTVGKRGLRPAFLFDMPLNEGERDALNYHVISEYTWLELKRQLQLRDKYTHHRSNVPVSSCWLHIHTDRTTPVHIKSVVIAR